MKKFVFAAMLLGSAAFAAPTMAAPIVYTFTGSFSGVNGGPFSDVSATFTGTADTSTVTTNGYSYYTPLTSLSAYGASVGTFVITDPTFFYINEYGYAGLEFGAFDDTSYFSGQSDSLLAYNGQTNVSTTPIDYFSGIDATFDTDRGSVTINNATGGTFAAATGAVPEPATWALMLAGFGMIGSAARRRQSIKTTVTFA